jgi:hypothetical protein
MQKLVVVWIMQIPKPSPYIFGHVKQTIVIGALTGDRLGIGIFNASVLVEIIILLPPYWMDYSLHMFTGKKWLLKKCCR